MAMLLKVKWVDVVDQADPYQRIRNIGGVSHKLEWKHSHDQAIQSIEQGMFCYYVEKDARALTLKIGMAPNGSKFLKTEADEDHPRLLLSLMDNSGSSQSKPGQEPPSSRH
jgi:hypothetical protein